MIRPHNIEHFCTAYFKVISNITFYFKVKSLNNHILSISGIMLGSEAKMMIII